MNSTINESTSYRSDAAQYAKPDYWEAASGTGDCEDYALAKRNRLIAAGCDPLAIHLATCWVETGEYHAVLIVNTSTGDYVLDNRYPFPMMRQDLEYKWDKMQEGQSWCACL